MLATLVVMLGLGRGVEVARVQEHLAGAEVQLRAADVSGLSDAQRERRAEVIEELARYRVRGEFPRNLDFAVRTPYFVDDRGVRCAMAHLIETFGGAELVARVAATANNAYVRDLAGDPELLAWLDTHGLTVAEAARIQPSYQRETGWWCDGSFTWCVDRCVPALDRPDELSYCTEACDPAADTCPIGMQGVAMTCQRVDGVDQCMYPEQTPGTTGWPCTLDTPEEPVCFQNCVVDRDTGEGACAADCPEDACAAGLACSYYSSPEQAECDPPVDGGGCSTGGGDPRALLVLLVALGLRGRPRRWTRSSNT